MKTKQLADVQSSVVLFVLLFVVLTVLYMTKNMFSSVMASIVEAGIMTKSQTGLISAVFWLVYGIFQVLGGFAVDKFSPYKMVIIGIVSGIAANMVIYFNQSYGVVMTVWAINAALQFGLWPGALKIATMQIVSSVRQTAVFWVLLSTSAGQAISLLVASVVPTWVDNFLVSAVALAVMLVVWMVVYKILESRMVEVELQVPVRTTKKDNTDMKTLIQKSGILWLVLISFLITTVSSALKTMLPVMLMESYEGLPAAAANRMGILLIAFSILGMLIANGFHRKVTDNETQAICVFVFLALPFLFIATTIGIWSYWLILVLISAAMIFVQATQPFSNSYPVTRFADYERSGTFAGILNASAAMGNVVATYIFAAMAEHVPWSGVVLSWGICGIVIIVIAVLLHKKWTLFINNTGGK